jgi:hypothetical protein
VSKYLMLPALIFFFVAVVVWMVTGQPSVVLLTTSGAIVCMQLLGGSEPSRIPTRDLREVEPPPGL